MSTEMLLAKEKLIKAIRTCLKNNNQPSKEKSIAVLLAKKSILTKPPVYYSDDDDDYDTESVISMNADMFETPSSNAITTSSPIEEPKDSLIMEDEDIETIPEKESGKDNESSAENLVQNPSESEATSDNESHEYSSDNESFLKEDVFSNLPFEFDIESISSNVNPIYDEVLEDIYGTNYLIDSIISFSPKIDPLLEEFAGELALINQFPQ
ncbi:hypothetical protein Tco_0678854 [Tanacetum coccineum]|uniref:Uncharacterized protein n=1 Tax=Tanacetum coccineum TaxID=301880 RepID=A0ABQ4XG80_9ASTR